MNNQNTSTKTGMSLTGLTLLWALITQCLTWAGVINFSWIAIWLPFLIGLGITFVVFIIALICVLIARL